MVNLIVLPKNKGCPLKVLNWVRDHTASFIVHFKLLLPFCVFHLPCPLVLVRSFSLTRKGFATWFWLPIILSGDLLLHKIYHTSAHAMSSFEALPLASPSCHSPLCSSSLAFFFFSSAFFLSSAFSLFYSLPLFLFGVAFLSLFLFLLFFLPHFLGLLLFRLLLS